MWDFLYFRIDRKRKYLFRLCYKLWDTKSDIVNEFYEKEIYTFDQNTKKWKTKFDPDNYK